MNPSFTIWLIGYLFYFGWTVGRAPRDGNNLADNWAHVICAMIFWPIMLGYDMGERHD